MNLPERRNKIDIAGGLGVGDWARNRRVHVGGNNGRREFEERELELRVISGMS